jgi:hypothetical protein
MTPRTKDAFCGVLASRNPAMLRKKVFPSVVGFRIQHEEELAGEAVVEDGVGVEADADVEADAGVEDGVGVETDVGVEADAGVVANADVADVGVEADVVPVEAAVEGADGVEGKDGVGVEADADVEANAEVEDGVGVETDVGVDADVEVNADVSEDAGTQVISEVTGPTSVGEPYPPETLFILGPPLFDANGEYIGDPTDGADTNTQPVEAPYSRDVMMSSDWEKCEGYNPTPKAGVEGVLDVRLRKHYTSAITSVDFQYYKSNPPLFTDWNSCLIDCINSGIGEQLLSRQILQVFGFAPTLIEVQDKLQPDYYFSRVLHSDGKNPTFQELCQDSKCMFLIQYMYLANGKWNYHYVMLDTCARVVLCNTLGVVPLHLGNAPGRRTPNLIRETMTSLKKVSKLLRFEKVLKVHCLLKKDVGKEKEHSDHAAAQIGHAAAAQIGHAAAAQIGHAAAAQIGHAAAALSEQAAAVLSEQAAAVLSEQAAAALSEQAAAVLSEQAPEQAAAPAAWMLKIPKEKARKKAQKRKKVMEPQTDVTI